MMRGVIRLLYFMVFLGVYYTLLDIGELGAEGYTLTMCGIIEAYVGTYILRKNRSRMTGS